MAAPTDLDHILDLAPGHDHGLDLEPGHDGAADLPHQLSMLPSSNVPVQFRLDRRTRELGLANIARIRRQLAERAAARDDAQVPARRPTAA